MTSTLKSSLTLTTSAIADGQGIDAADVLTPFSDALNHIKNGKLSVSANDTHAKHLNDALTVTAPISKSIGNAAADEALNLSFDTTNHGFDVTVVAGENITALDFVALDPTDSNKAYRIISTSTTHYGRLRGIALSSATTGQSFNVRLAGPVPGFSSLSVGSDYWIPSSAGAPSATNPNPSAGGSQVAKIWAGHALSATVMWYQIRPIRYAQRASLTNNSSFTITLAPNESPAYIRRYWATVNISGTLWEAAVVGRDGGGTRDVAVRLDNGSGSGDSNRITFKNVSGGTLDITGFCEVD